MRKASAVWTIAILGYMIGWGVAARAQDATPAKSETETKSSEHAEKPVHPYRADFSLNELEDGKKINTRQYSMNLNAGDANEIKIGTRVPVETGHTGDIQYMDVGTNIWCRFEERSDGIALSVRAENSNFAIPEQGAGHDARPVIRQLKISGSTLALLGKPMVVGSMDDPNSKRQFQLEVTVTKLR
jgi:hypothetical protein